MEYTMVHNDTAKCPWCKAPLQGRSFVVDFDCPYCGNHIITVRTMCLVRDDDTYWREETLRHMKNESEDARQNPWAYPDLGLNGGFSYDVTDEIRRNRT
jgi:predicted RNA-binding Zn-ribbon protein involved in translation (DUF1610 family)